MSKRSGASFWGRRGRTRRWAALVVAAGLSVWAAQGLAATLSTWENGAGADSIEATLAARNQAVEGSRRGILVDEAHRLRDSLFETIGLETAVGLSVLGQEGLSGSGTQGALSGEVTWDLRWHPFHLVRSYGHSPMTLNARLRYRGAVGGDAPSALGRDFGFAVGSADGFTDAGLEVPEFYFSHGFFDDRMHLRYGQMSADDLLDVHPMRGARRFLLHSFFASNPAVGFPSFGLGGAARWELGRGWELVGGVSNLEGNAQADEVSWSLSGQLFQALQLGRTWSGGGDGWTKVQVLGWRADAVPDQGVEEGAGISVTVSGEKQGGGLGLERWFGRAAWADGGDAPYSELVAGGVEWAVGEPVAVGVGIGGGRLAADGQRDGQGLAEAYVRWTPSPLLEVSPDLQLLVGDGLGAGDGWAVIGGLRVRVAW